jgi:hypothetical protein
MGPTGQVADKWPRTRPRIGSTRRTVAKRVRSGSTQRIFVTHDARVASPGQERVAERVSRDVDIAPSAAAVMMESEAARTDA